MSDDYISHGDAETKIFRSTDSSSNCEPDTTTSPLSKIKLSDPIRQPVDSECFCSHLKVSKLSFSLGCQFVCLIQFILVYLTCVLNKERCVSMQ